jgi:hypothetical protein
MQASTVGKALSRMGSTTRNRLQASQAQNSQVAAPSITGPAAKSHWNQYADLATMRRRSVTVDIVAGQRP